MTPREAERHLDRHDLPDDAPGRHLDRHDLPDERGIAPAGAVWVWAEFAEDDDLVAWPDDNETEAIARSLIPCAQAVEIAEPGAVWVALTREQVDAIAREPDGVITLANRDWELIVTGDEWDAE